MQPGGDILARRLAALAPLSEAERRMLAVDPSQRVRRTPARADIVREGDAPGDLRLLLSGWAARYKMLDDGRRQIVGLLLPGDLFDLHMTVLHELDHSIAALTDLRLVEIPHERLDQVLRGSGAIARALRRYTLMGAAIQREWLLSLGQRTAFERLGHLLCEIHIRLSMVGLTNGNACDMPMTQTEMADATGITPVHVNRTLQEMRARGLIVLKGRILEIPDLDQLKQVSLFSDAYLQSLGARRPPGQVVALGAA
ncbi:Crp/Fnr family transcriptional regulator [Sphingomonas morindae]|uniref:Crp/Fnr family transcriptional regulator n=1 Tax=Sphingomonas morindae TaxID=1541170 RepID=A0ABY4X5A0_9SPHN|nr:Crp/Fnr family transcriptional regulator [Sphingomonas morindae]USI72088.1 Crp/Fnr family transcriptional regulator [Sphingomonas morindae]